MLLPHGNVSSPPTWDGGGTVNEGKNVRPISGLDDLVCVSFNLNKWCAKYFVIQIVVVFTVYLMVPVIHKSQSSISTTCKTLKPADVLLSSCFEELEGQKLCVRRESGRLGWEAKQHSACGGHHLDLEQDRGMWRGVTSRLVSGCWGGTRLESTCFWRQSQGKPLCYSAEKPKTTHRHTHTHTHTGLYIYSY